MSAKTVLYVEDNEYNLKIVRQLLARTSYRLIEAMDGELGVETARKELPDLILMDIQLPKLSGLDATRMLRADPQTAAIPIIVITSYWADVSALVKRSRFCLLSSTARIRGI